MSFFEKWSRVIKSMPVRLDAGPVAPDRQSFVAEVLYRQWNEQSDDVPFAEANTQVIAAFMDDAEELLAELDAFDRAASAIPNEA